MSEASKLSPAPLDAYETAKPDEPIFTLQGGDPLAAPLVRIWAYLARVRAGLSGDASMIDAPIYVAKINSVEHDPDQCRELLVRATAAEQVSWHMDGYRRGEINDIAEATSLSNLDKLDIWDIRRRCSSYISNSFSNLDMFREELVARGFMEVGGEIDLAVDNAISSLETVHGLIEVRRGK